MKALCIHWTLELLESVLLNMNIISEFCCAIKTKELEIYILKYNFLVIPLESVGREKTGKTTEDSDFFFFNWSH